MGGAEEWVIGVKVAARRVSGVRGIVGVVVVVVWKVGSIKTAFRDLYIYLAPSSLRQSQDES